MSESAADPQVTLVVLSCDAYRDLWRPCLTLIDRRWPDCPYPKVLVSETVSFSWPGVRTVTVGEGLSWSGCLQVALGALGTPYVLLMLEDYFLMGRVDTERVAQVVSHAQRLSAGMVRLLPVPGPDVPVPDVPELGALAAEAGFRTSLQAALWRREVLASLLVAGESPWEFETRGTERSRSRTDLYCTWDRVFPAESVVYRGVWFRDEAAVYRAMDVGCDFTARPTMSLARQAWWTGRRRVLLRLRRLLSPLGAPFFHGVLRLGRALGLRV